LDGHSVHKYGEHHVNHEHRDQQQDRQRTESLLERLRIAGDENVTPRGNTSAAISLTWVTASPIDNPGARLKESTPTATARND